MVGVQSVRVGQRVGGEDGFDQEVEWQVQGKVLKVQQEKLVEENVYH